MNLNFLAQSGTLGYGVATIPDISLNWIGQLIQILIEAIPFVGLGIIVFTLILKTIVLPLDIFSRIKGKKQALVMERMRPQMEKLQKQYANDKTMYNQKVMELQKKSGYSAFGACLPMIVSLVIFIIVFNAFSTYSQYANLRNYKDMVGKYNGVVAAYCVDSTDEYGEVVYLKNDDGSFCLDENGNKIAFVNDYGFLYEVVINSEEIARAKSEAEGGVNNTVFAEKDYRVDYERYARYYYITDGGSIESLNALSEEAKAAKVAAWEALSGEEKAAEQEKRFTALAEAYKNEHRDSTDYSATFNIDAVNSKTEQGELSDAAVAIRNTLVSKYIEGFAAQEVYDFYKGVGKYESDGPHDNHFLWIRNIWYPDSAFYKEMPDFASFKKTVSQARIGDDYEETYNKVTLLLDKEKTQVNGYFVLIVLSIGFMLLQQWLSMRANKSVNDLSTVDGSGARTNKWMMIMMPIIYGIFSFFYSASFSLYMITNTIYGIITMLIINKCVDVWFRKKDESGELEEILNKKSKKARKVRRVRR